MKLSNSAAQVSTRLKTGATPMLLAQLAHCSESRRRMCQTSAELRVAEADALGVAQLARRRCRQARSAASRASISATSFNLIQEPRIDGGELRDLAARVYPLRQRDSGCIAGARDVA